MHSPVTQVEMQTEQQQAPAQLTTMNTPRVVVVNEERLREFRAQKSLSKTQFIIDYDFTITKTPWMQPENVERHGGGSCFSAIQTRVIFEQEVLDFLNANFAKYRQMELNLKMEDEQKKQMFDDWWRAR